MSLITMILMFATWSNIFTLGKMTLQYCPPVFLTSIRMIFAGMLLISYLLIRKKFNMKKAYLFPILLLALFSIYLTNIFEFWGLQHLSAAKTCFIYSLSPFFAALFSYIHFKEKMTKKKWLGFAIGFIGFIPVLMIQSGSENILGGISIFSWPELAVMGATLCSVYGWVLLRLLVKNNSLSPLLANGVSMLIGGVLALIHSFFVDTWAPTPIVAGGLLNFTKGVLLITIISNIICFNVYGWLLKKYSATFLSFVGLLSPIFASLSEWAILRTAPNPIIFLSTGVVISGVWLVYQAEIKQGYIVRKKKPLRDTVIASE